jgi:DNA-binding PadR family transcriptional regulator
MNHPHRHHFGPWMKHMAHVPKGFLKYVVLKMLDEKPLSGSEIMNEIEEKTKGHWKPSPGSIYPLLSWLQEKKYTEEAVNQEPGMKRYTLTEEGKAFLQEHIKKQNEINERFDAFRSPFYRNLWFNAHSDEIQELWEAEKKLIKTGWRLLDSLNEKYSEEIATQTAEVINQATGKLEEIAEKLKKAD